MSDIEKQINIMQAEDKSNLQGLPQHEIRSLDHTAETHELSVAAEQLYSARVSPDPTAGGARGGS